MGILQDPVKALDQVEWYINNAHQESFPGAFQLAAGSLCRQTLEQILFLLCFYSGMPQHEYLRRDRTLHVAGRLVKALQKIDTASGRTYLELARQAGPRIRKLARQPKSLERWQRELNEPAHYSTRFRSIDENDLREFVIFVRTILDEYDKYAIVAAINEIFTNGTYRAILGKDKKNMPGISKKIVVGPSAFTRGEDGRLVFQMPETKWTVISETKVPRGRWPRNSPIIVQNTAGITIRMEAMTKSGDPVDLTSLASVIASLAKSEGQRRYLKGHFRRLGFEISFVKN